MNGENKYAYYSSVLYRAEPGREAMPPGAWRWIAIGQLWMLAGFTGLSLVVIAVLSFFHGGAGHGRDELLATAFAGTLQHRHHPAPRRRASPPVPAPAALTGITPRS